MPPLFSRTRKADGLVACTVISQEEFALWENLPAEKENDLPCASTIAGGPFVSIVRILPSPIMQTERSFAENSKNADLESSNEIFSCAAAAVFEVAAYAIAASERNSANIRSASIESWARKRN